MKAKTKQIFASVVFIALTLLYTSIISFASYKGSTRSLRNKTSLVRVMTVTYHPNGATADDVTEVIPCSDGAALRTNTLNRTGYTYNGWNTKANGTGTAYADKAPLAGIPGSSLNLYAVWNVIPYSISYNLNGGLISGEKNEYNVETPTFTLPTPTRDGYEFTGWTWDGMATPQKPVTIPKGTTGNKSYTANWKSLYVPFTVYHRRQGLDENYTLYETENLQGLTNSNVTPEVKTYSGFTAPSTQTVPVKADGTTTVTYNYTRNSYALTINKGTGIANVTGSGTYKYGAPVTVTYQLINGYDFDKWTGNQTEVPFNMPAYNVNMTAEGKAHKYGISYNLNGGTITGAPPDYTIETSNFTLPEPTKAGYTFTGWTGSNGATPQTSVTILMGTTGDKNYTANWSLNTYGITYNLNGGSISGEPGSYTVETPSFTLPEPTKTGYTFTGWTGSNGSTPEKTVTILKGTTENKSYTANWTATTYNITYDLNGGSAPGKPENYNIETANFTLPEPTKTGYTFIGWTGSNGMTPETSVTIPKGTVGDKSYTANWTATTYNITYNLNGGSAPGKPENYTIETSNFTLPTPTKTGYTFTGWTGSNGTTPETSVTIPKGTVGDKNYTANWTATTYNIAYDLKGGSISGEPKNYTIETANFTLPTPTKTGYTFTGWTGSNGTTPETSVTIPKGTTGNKSYTANWTATTYNITYNLNGGSAPGKPESYNIETANFTLPTPTKTGYTFTGWTGSNGSTPEITVTIPRGTTGNKSYTANWTPTTYSITYNLNGGSAPRKPENYTIETANFTLPTPTKTGYTFTGWTGSNGSTPEITVTIPRGTTGNKSYTANWTPTTYSITYNLNGGSAPGKPENYTIETANFTLPTPTKTGYTFTGWTGSNGSTPETSVTIPKGTVGDKNYTANWSIITYNITYNLNGGSISGEPKNFTVETANFTLPEPTRAGYTFTGWTGSNGTIPQPSVSINKGSTGNRSYAANWTANTNTAYKVSHQLQNIDGNYIIHDTENFTGTTDTSVTPTVKIFEGFTSPSAQTVNIKGDGSTVVVYKYTRNTYTLTLEKGAGINSMSGEGDYKYAESVNIDCSLENGYEFSNWSGGKTGSQKQMTFVMPADNITVIANASPIEYTINYNLNGGSISGQKAKYTIETDTFTLPSPTKTGYTFTGWTGSNGAVPQISVSINKGSTGEKSYTANWTAITYNIAYNLNGGTISGEPKTYTIETPDFTLPAPTRTDYAFMGWTWNGETTPQKPVTITQGSTGNRAYTANWADLSHIPYKVLHKREGLDENFTTYETENLEGRADTSVTPAVKHYTGFTSPETQTVIIDVEGTTTVTYNYTRNSYELTVNKGTGIASTTGSGQHKYGAPVTAGYQLMPGYDFDKWTGEQTDASFNMPANDVSMTANGKIHTYTISYNLNGGSISGEATSYDVETPAFTLKTPTKTGYNFAGWTGEGISTPQATVTIPKGSTGNRTYTANWTVSTYSITYNLNGGSISGETTSYTIETNTFTLKTPTKTGYTFTGWTGEGISTPQTTVTIAKGSTGNRTYTANWTVNTYSITYNLNGGSISGETTSYTIETNTFTLKTPTKTGYNFAGWTGEGISTPQPSVTITKGSTGNRTYTANWTAATYSITYNLNGGSISGETTSYTIETNTFTLKTPTKTGYNFAGWTGEGISTPQTTVTIAKGSTGNRTYTANWTVATYSITYNLDGGSISGETTSYTIETNTFTLKTPTKTGYTFAGWTGTGLSSAQTTVNIAKGSTGNRTYTAHWTANTNTPYKVYHRQQGLDGNYTTYETQNLTGTTGASVTPATKSYTGFKSPSTQTITISADGNASVTYNYERLSYNVSVSNGAGISSVSGGGSKKYGESVTVSCTPSSGYNFGSWTATGISAGTTASFSFTMPDNNVTLQAKGTLINYTITYNLNGGTNPGNPTSYNVGTATFALSAPSKTGYTFAGWTGTGLSSAQTTVSITKGSTGNRAYTANWTANTNTPYKVYHRQQGLDGNYTTYETQDLTGTTGASVTPATKSYTGFKSPSTQTITISADGNASVTYNYERLSYNVSVSNGAGISSVSGGGSKKYGESVTVSCTPSSGYNFGSWTATGISAGTTASFSFTMPDNNVSLQAFGSAISYTITYNLDGGTNNASNPASYTVASLPITLGTPAKANYTFKGWTGSNGTTPQTSVSIAAGTTGALTYTANWEMSLATYTVIHRWQNTTGSSYTVHETETLYGTPGANVTPAVKFYTGFVSPSTKTITVNANGTSSVTYDYTRETYQVTLLKGETGISSVSGSGSRRYGAEVTIKYSLIKGYEFTGWTGTSIALTQGSDENTFTFTMPRNDVTLTANGQLATYTITYELGGGYFRQSSQPTTYTYLSDDIEIARARRDGYEFLGWTGSNGTTPERDVTLKAKSTGNKTYTANWGPLGLTIIEGNQGDENDTQAVTYVNQFNKLVKGLLHPEVSIPSALTPDYLVKHIKRSYTPAPESANAIEVQYSGAPIDAWFDSSSSTLYYYSTAATIYTKKYESNMFEYFHALETIDISTFNTSRTTYMNRMFCHCDALKEVDLSNFETSQVKNMGGMFENCFSLTNVNLSSFNTTSLEKMSNMFYHCDSLTELDLSSFHTPSLKYMGGTFEFSANLRTIYTSEDFYADGKLIDDSTNEQVNALMVMFSGCTSLVGGNGFAHGEQTHYTNSCNNKIYAVIDTPSTPGYFTRKLKTDVKYTVLHQQEQLDGSFKTVWDLKLYGTAGSSVRPFVMSYDGYVSPAAQTVTINANGNTTVVYKYSLKTVLDTGEKVNAAMKKLAKSTATYSTNDGIITAIRRSTTAPSGTPVSISISGYPVYIWLSGSTVYYYSKDETIYMNPNCKHMFYYYKLLTTIDLSGFNSSQVTDMSYMFKDSIALTSLNLSGMNTSSVTNMSYMFDGCKALSTLNISSFNTSNVTNMKYMFDKCSALTTLNLNHFNTSNVTDMSYMFAQCSALTNPGVNRFNTENVTTMAYMFQKCTSLASIDISGFNTMRLKSMGSMFNGCTNLTTIFASNNFTVASVTSGSAVFTGDTKLKGGSGTAYSSSNATYKYAIIDGGTSNPGYFTYRAAPATTSASLNQTQSALFVVSDDEVLVAESDEKN